MHRMRLGFHYHVPVFEENGLLRTPGYQGVFIDSLANECDELILFLHTSPPCFKKLCDYTIKAKNVQWVDLGLPGSVTRRTLLSSRFVKPLKRYHNSLDVLLLRGPTPLLPAMARAAGDLPVALLLVGDFVANAQNSQLTWWKAWLDLVWSTWYTCQQTGVARASLTFVNSRKLYNDLRPVVSHLVEIRTTTLGENDFYQRADTCQTEPFHILYTGRMDRAKGLFEMIDMVKILSDQGENILLELVGWPNPGDTIIDDLQMQASRLGIADRIRYLGYKPLGPELFNCYQKADLYVLASKSSFEGFPRTIWEAMAHSLPVVATRVGSIPDFIEGAADLVAPGSSIDLASAVSRLIHQPNLRKIYIEKGQGLAHSNTLKVQAKKMVIEIRKWLAGNE